MGKKRKGIIRSFTDETDEGEGLKKLPFYTVDVEMPWGTDEYEVPEVALREEEKKQ